MASSKFHLLRWLIFCEDFPGGSFAQDKNTQPIKGASCVESYDTVADRWRLLFWAVVCMGLFNLLQPWDGLFIFAPALLALFGLLVDHLTRTKIPPASGGSLHKWGFPLAVCLLCALIALPSTATFAYVEHLVTRFLQNEYVRGCHWCPETYLTIASSTLLTFLLRGVYTTVHHCLAKPVTAAPPQN